MADYKQHRYLNGILIPQLLEALGIEVNKANRLEVKSMFKRYLKTYSTAALDDKTMSKFIEAFRMLCSRELGYELPFEDAEKSMTQLLKEYDHE